MNIMNDMFLNRLNDIRRRRCISIEKGMYDFFVRRTLSVKALRAICCGACCVFIDINALRAKLKMKMELIKKNIELANMFLNRNIRRRRCISIKKEMCGVVFVRRTLTQNKCEFSAF